MTITDRMRLAGLRSASSARLAHWVLAVIMLVATAVHGYPIDATIPEGSGAPSACIPQADMASNSSSFRGQFGSSAHEELTRRTVDWARSGKTRTKPEARLLDALLARPVKAQRTVLACCRYVASSHHCRCLNDGDRLALFSDPDPIVTGSRWPDDPCHLLARSSTYFIPVHWFLGRSSWGNNLFYLSHFHDFAFLHSMAASGQKDDRSVELTVVTRRRILTWLEFALGVASGHVPTGATFAQAQALLSPEARPEFGRMFPGFVKQTRRWTVDFMFVGVEGAEALHVRQVALGAALHTVQDAFSDAHVRRQDRPRLGLPQPVTDVGPVVQVLDYKQQDQLDKHASGDAPPRDLFEPASAGTLHPISVGAELIVCAAGTGTAAAAINNSESAAWSCARPFVQRVYELAPSRRRATGAGDYR
jgi:hypothetical protein